MLFYLGLLSCAPKSTGDCQDAWISWSLVPVQVEQVGGQPVTADRLAQERELWTENGLLTMEMQQGKTNAIVALPGATWVAEVLEP